MSMAVTKKLFDNGTLFEFDAAVLSCVKSESGYEVTLDRSAFFPEGGGQPGDTGRLGSAAVTDTFERDGEVIHICASPLEPGSTVHGAVDEKVRIRRMQNHSGEHLLMGFIHRKYGLENVGFRLGASDVTLDLDGVISPEALAECEMLANEAIARDVPVTVSYPSPEELSRTEYRSKLEMTENVRLVTIEGIDVCACCAPHVSSTGMIGIVKVLWTESSRGGTRVHILCGLDALELFSRRLEGNARISRLLSAKPENTAEAVERLLNENNELKRRLRELEIQRTDELIASLGSERRGSFCVFAKGLNADSLRRIANAAVLLTDGAAGVFCETEGGYSYIIASNSIPLRARAKEINSALNGRGGGSDTMIQGSVTACRERIEEYFRNL